MKVVKKKMKGLPSVCPFIILRRRNCSHANIFASLILLLLSFEPFIEKILTQTDMALDDLKALFIDNTSTVMFHLFLPFVDHIQYAVIIFIQTDISVHEYIIYL